MKKTTNSSPYQFEGRKMCIRDRSKAAAGMAASKQETLFLPVYGKNKMPDDPGVLLLA